MEKMVKMEKMPAWLDKVFLKHVLEDGKGQEAGVRVLSFSSAPVELPVKNFTSSLHKVKVTYLENTSKLEKTIRLIIKEPITGGVFAEICKREPIVYSQLLKDVYKKTKCNFGPKSLVSPIENFLVMEDLQEKRFVLTENAKQLDYVKCEKVFYTIAKFHAATIACYHEDPSFVDLVVYEVVYVDKGVMHPWVENSAKGMIEAVDEMNGDQRFAKYLRSKVDDMWDMSQNKYKAKPTGINVLNHGDLHKKNILFQINDSGMITDIKFVDFQNTRYGSPVLDLLYFMWTSADENVREHRQGDLYHLYLQTFNETLEQLGCEERMTKEMLQEELKWATDWALLNFCVAFPLVMAKPEETEEFAHLKHEDFETMKFKKLFHGKLFRPLLPASFRQFADFFLSGGEIL